MKIKTIITVPMFLVSAHILAQANYIFEHGFEEGGIRLNDTGITFAPNISTNSTTCTSDIAGTHDCNVGRDFTHNNNNDGHAGFSYTKLDINGNPMTDQNIPYAYVPWHCVKDNVTGLVWEVKSNDPSSIHYKQTSYRWGGVTAIGLGGVDAGTYYPDWDVLVNGSNTNNLCGSNNWRVPTMIELGSLLNRSVITQPIAQGTIYPAIDQDYFPNTLGSINYWSSIPFALTTNNAWGIYSSASFDSLAGRTDLSAVRLVHN